MKGETLSPPSGFSIQFTELLRAGTGGGGSLERTSEVKKYVNVKSERGEEGAKKKIMREKIGKVKEKKIFG